MTESGDLRVDGGQCCDREQSSTEINEGSHQGGGSVVPFINMGLDSRWELCWGWGHIASQCSNLPMCGYCSGPHRTRDHKYNGMGCNAKQDTLCGHTGTPEKCHNCKGNQIAFNSRCAKMTEAAKVLCQRKTMGLARGAKASEVTEAAMGANRVAPVMHFV